MADIFTVRASSWSSLFDCAHRFEGVQILGLKSVSGLRAQLGTAIHAGTAAFDLARMIGEPIEPCTAGQYLVDALRNPDREVDYSRDSLTLKEAERIGLNLLVQYCQEISPRYTFSSIEMETKPFDIDVGGGLVIRLTGTLDRSRVVEVSGGKLIADLKSGTNAVEKGEAKTKGHGAQVGTYELLYEYTTGEPITEPAEIIGLKTDGKPEIAVGQIHNARELMVGTDEYPGLIDHAASMFRTGLFPPNPQSMMCGEKYCPRWSVCRFR
jgi:hypothetical protein